MIDKLSLTANSIYFLKAKAFGSVAFVFGAFLLPVFEMKEALISLLLLLIFDFATGVYAAYRNKKDVNSAGIFKTAVKITFYFVLISAAFHTENAVPFGFIDDSVIAFLAVTELISILENTSKAGYAIPRKLMKKLQSLNDKL